MASRPGVRILLLEPDPTAATLMVEAVNLRAADLHVVRALTLADALEIMAEQPCDVALAELNLADAQGLQTLVRLRESNPGLPVVVLTTMTDEDLAITAIQQGAQDYLIKESVHYALISRSIRYAMERKRIEVELQTAKERALSASAAKSEFLARMSHEIRNPLSAIVNYADILLDPDFTAGEREAAIETIRHNSLHLLEVVNDVLDISKIESRAFAVERVECSPRQIVAEVIEMFQTRVRDKGLSLTAEYRPGLPAAIVSDPLRLKQILVNLVSNSVKFTERGHIRITLELAPPGGPAGDPGLQIVVTDTGIGISPAQRERLFQAYQQSDVWVARQFGGTGLGLAISRELARKLGGDIAVESTLGVGSAFTVRIAAGGPPGTVTKAPPETQAAIAPAAAAPATTPPTEISGRVLVADDGPDNRRLIATLLRRAGVAVEMAENGRQALELALHAQDRGQPYDLILMDMVMPEMDGFTATRQLREAGYTQPIVALTANTGTGARPECLAAGCDAFASKPIDRATLVALVQQWLPQPAAAAPRG